MNKYENVQNISFILYLIPFLASSTYALFLWIPKGLSLNLPLTVYLRVTKDPYLFLLGSISICSAVLIETYFSKSELREKLLNSNSRQIQFLATLSILFALISVWSTSSYSFNTNEISLNLLSGKYALIFPLILFILSLLINPKFKIDFLSFNNLKNYISIILVISSPVILYLLSRLDISWIIILPSSLILLLLGLLIQYKTKDFIS